MKTVSKLIGYIVCYKNPYHILSLHIYTMDIPQRHEKILLAIENAISGCTPLPNKITSRCIRHIYIYKERMATLMYQATAANREDIVRLIGGADDCVKEGFRLGASNTDALPELCGQSSFDYAIRYASYDTLREHIKIITVDSGHRPVLNMAIGYVKRYDLNGFERLLKSGFDPSIDYGGGCRSVMSFVYRAVHMGYMELLQMIIAYSTEPDGTVRNIDTNNTGRVALMDAINSTQPDMVRILLDSKVSPSPEHTIYHQPLLKACHYVNRPGGPEIVELLLSAGATISGPPHNEWELPFGICCVKDIVKCVQNMVDKYKINVRKEITVPPRIHMNMNVARPTLGGHTIVETGIMHKTPLELAYESRSANVIRFLLDRGAKIRSHMKPHIFEILGGSYYRPLWSPDNHLTMTRRRERRTVKLILMIWRRNSRYCVLNRMPRELLWEILRFTIY